MGYRPDAEHLRVINLHGGEHLVLASPGCGKTSLLGRRVEHAKEQYGVSFADMLCLTFTNRAGREMAEAINKFSGQNSEELYVGNIHRFCLRFLLSNGLLGRDIEILDEEEQSDWLKSELHLDKAWQRKLFKDAKRWNFLDVNGLHEVSPFARAPHDFQKYIAGLEKYEEFKAGNRLIDFDDILYNTLKATRESDFKKLKNSDFKWVQVDEVQDLTPIQLAIIKGFTHLSAQGESTSVYFGDDKQAIFEFNGAGGVAIDILKKQPGIMIHNLNTNYRSNAELTEACNNFAVSELGVSRALLPRVTGASGFEKAGAVFENSVAAEPPGEYGGKREDVSLRGNELRRSNLRRNAFQRFLKFFFGQRHGEQNRELPKETYHPALRLAVTNSQQLKALCSAFAEKLLNDFPDENVGIFTRTNAEAAEISECLERTGLEHILISKTDAFTSKSFKAITSFLHYITDSKKITSLLRHIEICGRDYNDVIDEITALRDRYFKLYKSEERGDEFTLPRVITLIYIDLLQRNYIKEIPRFYELLEMLDRRWHPGGGANVRFREDLDSHLHELRMYKETDLLAFDQKLGRLSVMTIHKAKGLEMDNVIIYNASIDQHGRLDTARVMYVAMSRAKKRLTVLSENNLSTNLTGIYDRFEVLSKEDINHIVKYGRF